MFNNPLYIIFSDLDGTLLDHDTYEYTDAAEALEYIKREKIPLVLCSRKTRPEIEYYRTRLGLEDPFISENRADIFISKGTQDIDDVPFVEYEGYKVIELGVPYNRIKSCFAEIKAETGLKILGFSEMSVAQVVEFTGLSHDAAKLAHMRDYSEPFLFMEEESRLEVLERAVHKKGLKITKGGRFYHLIGDNDKGKALRIVRKLYEQEGRSLISIGLGDSLNDLPMLENVDIPVLVQKKTGEYEPWTGNKKIVFAPGVGPKGWNRAVLEIFRIEE
ncbi:MAG: HAD-IIB family hydrolase [Deltaproteobacteria bacterium]|nr:HAD-IIB family hydrolase [Deltaproteobacteria bacterium]